jgi:hypothetical protein
MHSTPQQIAVSIPDVGEVGCFNRLDDLLYERFFDALDFSEKSNIFLMSFFHCSGHGASLWEEEQQVRLGR